MKVLVLSDNTNPANGGGRLASNLISGLKNAGAEVEVLEKLSLFSFFRVRERLKTVDLVHAMDGYPYAIVAALANLGLGKKFIITLVGTYSVAPLYSAKTGWLLRWAYRQADAVTAISNFTRREVAKRVKLRDIKVITPGIFPSLGLLSPSPRAGEGRGEGGFILSVGALKYRKGYHISIPAFARAKKQIPGLRYKIVGDQGDINYFNKLKQLVRELNVEKDVDFLTGLPDEELSGLYQEARLFLLTSINHNHHFEGFGIVFLEAAASGLPCIGTSDCGIEDAMKDGENGFLVPQNDIEATVKKILDILSDKSQYDNFSRNSVKLAKENSEESSVAKYLEIYKAIL